MNNHGKVVEFLNQKFGSDLDSLSDLESLITEFKERCKEQEDLISRSEVSTKEGINKAMESCKKLLQDIEASQSSILSILKNYSDYKSQSDQQKKELEKVYNQCESLHKERCLMEWTDKLSVISKKLDEALTTVDFKSVVKNHQKLFDLCSRINSSKCAVTKKMFFDASDYYYEKAKDILKKDFDSVMTSMKYPFPTGISSPVFNKKENTESKLKDIILTAVQLQSTSLTDSYTQLAELLVMPMKKRFRFHFYGEKQTNNIEKPEWYFYKVVNWIRDHKDFWQSYIQNILTENGHDSVDIKSECIDLLLKLCVEKLQASIDSIIEDNYLFGHLIDETIRFQKELKNEIVYTSSACLDVLFQPDIFKHWLHLEEKIGKDTLIKMMDEENEPWSLKYEGLLWQEKKNSSILYFIPRCVEDYMTFLSLMISRHKSLDNVPCQLKFLDVLQKCLNEFIVQLKDVATLEVIRPYSQRFCSIINGVHYIKCVLDEWNDDLYFLMLKDFTNEEFPTPSTLDSSVVNQDISIRTFDELIVNLERFRASLIESVAECVELMLHDKMDSYKNQKWHGLPSLKDYILPILSAAGCDVMLLLKEQLHQLQSMMSTDVFEEVWKQIASTLDKKIFAEVAFDTHFNEGGASQFHFDMKNNLFVLWCEYTPKPELYFKLVSESCILLNLLPGSAALLKELLQQAEKKFNHIGDKENFVRDSLNELSVTNLTYTQVKRILENRIDWPRV